MHYYLWLKKNDDVNEFAMRIQRGLYDFGNFSRYSMPISQNTSIITFVPYYKDAKDSENRTLECLNTPEEALEKAISFIESKGAVTKKIDLRQIVEDAIAKAA